MGIVIGILNAAALAASNIFIKKLLGFGSSFLILLRTLSAVLIIAVLITVFSSWRMPPLDFFLIIVLAIMPLEFAIHYLSIKTLRLSPLSLVAPLGSFTNLFLIPIGYIFLEELPTFIGGIGVLLIILGTFFIGWNGNEQILYGLKNILRDRGARLAILSSFIGAISISLTKFSFNFAAPLVVGFYVNLFLSLPLFLFLWRQRYSEEFPKRSRKNSINLAGLSLASALSIALHQIGLSLIPAVYYMSIKRLSILFNVLSGKVFFDEGQFKSRLIGALLMLGGLFLITLG